MGEVIRDCNALGLKGIYPQSSHFTDVATEAQKKGLGQGHQHSDGTTVTGPCCLDFQPSTGSGGSEHSESEYAWVWPLSPLPTV